MFVPDTFVVTTIDGHNFTMVGDVNYMASDGTIILIPDGTKSDGASTPACMWNIIPPFGTYWRAAFLHDYLYRCTKIPKEQCDLIFKEAMLECCTNLIEVETIYNAVKLLGVEAFRKDRNA